MTLMSWLSLWMRSPSDLLLSVRGFLRCNLKPSCCSSGLCSLSLPLRKRIYFCALISYVRAYLSSSPFPALRCLLQVACVAPKLTCWRPKSQCFRMWLEVGAFKQVIKLGWTQDTGDMSSIPGSGRSPGGGNGYPLQCSSLKNPMDRGVWQATVQGVAKSQTWLSN